MPRIQVLEKQVAELIAAGEVVERPSSVIKELVENAVDAGSSVITVEIRRGGITFMRVTDNGCGIDPEDVPTAFLRHATSKIRAQGDLDSIGTLGFRGEALASISAVAHVELLTRTRGALAGVRYTCGGEEEPTLEEAGCPEGTTILVRDLFFNTPARMKFLKKDQTEGNSVAQILDKMALSHPEISFRFIRDGKEVLRTAGDNKLSSAIYGVYGREFLRDLLPVEYEYEHVKVTGYVSAPTASRPTRSMQNFFINGRYVRSRTAMAALEEAFKGSVMVGKYPACVLQLQLSFAAVDVNVHPAKMEVRFVNERPIFDAVYHGVRSALNREDRPKTMELPVKRPVQPYAPVLERHEQVAFSAPAKEPSPRWEKVSPLQDSVSAPVLHDAVDPRQENFAQYADRILEEEPVRPVPRWQDIPAPVPETPAPPQAAAAPDRESDRPPVASARPMVGEFHGRIIGEAFDTYILVEYSDKELMFIDKHAAHERLLYEKLKRGHTVGEAQTLLEPVPVTLEKDEYTAVLDHREDLLQAGYEVEDYGLGTVLVRSVPLLLDGEDAAASVMEIAGYLAALKVTFTTEHLDWVYHNTACRAAMKGGDHTTREELIQLARELEENPEVRYCPHGRPIYILLKKSEIEKQFGRA